jgi:4-diphosphocytidyl-2-C-methyl-D-erythritol kinase
MLAALEAGDLREIARRMYNVFEDALPPTRQAVIREIKNTLVECGALAACMSGTGPTVFGIFQQEKNAARAAKLLKETYPDTFLARPV